MERKKEESYHTFRVAIVFQHMDLTGDGTGKLRKSPPLGPIHSGVRWTIPKQSD